MQVIDCSTWETGLMSHQRFFTGLMQPESEAPPDKPMLKLKDWPPEDAFSSRLPLHNHVPPAPPPLPECLITQMPSALSCACFGLAWLGSGLLGMALLCLVSCCNTLHLCFDSASSGFNPAVDSVSVLIPALAWALVLVLAVLALALASVLALALGFHSGFGSWLRLRLRLQLSFGSASARLQLWLWLRLQLRLRLGFGLACPLGALLLSALVDCLWRGVAWLGQALFRSNCVTGLGLALQAAQELRPRQGCLLSLFCVSSRNLACCAVLCKMLSYRGLHQQRCAASVNAECTAPVCCIHQKAGTS